MKNIERKNNTVFDISFTALMCAINVVITLIARFLPLSFLFLSLLIPVVGVFESKYCKPQFLIAYILISAGVCLATNISDMSLTIFYVFPALIIGSLMGIMINHKFYIQLICIVATLGELLLSYLSIPIIDMIFEIDIVGTIAKMFGLGNFAYLDIIVPTVIFLVSLVQIVFTIIIVFSFSKALQIDIIFYRQPTFFGPFFALILCMFSILFVLFEITKPIPIMFFCIALVFVIFELPNLDLKNYKFIATFGFSFSLSLILFLLCGESIQKPFQILLFETMIFALSMYIIIVLIIKRREEIR